MEGIGGRKMKSSNEVKYNLVKNLKIKKQKNKQSTTFFSHTTVQIRSTDPGGLKYDRQKKSMLKNE